MIIFESLIIIKKSSIDKMTRRQIEIYFQIFANFPEFYYFIMLITTLSKNVVNYTTIKTCTNTGLFLELY